MKKTTLIFAAALSLSSSVGSPALAQTTDDIKFIHAHVLNTENKDYKASIAQRIKPDGTLYLHAGDKRVPHSRSKREKNENASTPSSSVSLDIKRKGDSNTFDLHATSSVTKLNNDESGLQTPITSTYETSQSFELQGKPVVIELQYGWQVRISDRMVKRNSIRHKGRTFLY